MQTCDKCEKYKTCTTLCKKAEQYVNKDYVSKNKFPAARRYPEGSEQFWNGCITLDWVYSKRGLGDSGNCATLEKTLDREVDLSFLTMRKRQCVELFYYEGKKAGEIADILGVKRVTVRKWLSLARQEMSEREEFKELFDEYLGR